MDSRLKDSNSYKNDIFYYVLVLSDKYYLWIVNIFVNSGKFVWMNFCEYCGSVVMLMFEIKCLLCGKDIKVRLYIIENNGIIWSIKGFRMSYKWIYFDGLLFVIIININVFSSDNKLYLS